MELWRWLARHFDARRLVFVDESGFNTSMTRLVARAPRGERAYGKVPRNRGKNQTLESGAKPRLNDCFHHLGGRDG